MKLPLWWLCLIAVLPGFAAENASRALTARQRLEPERLKAVHEARERFARERRELPPLSAFADCRAVIQGQAGDADPEGTRAEVLAAAKKTGVHVVIFTGERGTKSETWRGLRDGVLFVAAAEANDGTLRIPEFDADGNPRAGQGGALKFLGPIKDPSNAETKGFNGMVIVSRHGGAGRDNLVEEYLAATAREPVAWRKALENFAKWPDEMSAAGDDSRPEVLAKWDTESRKGRFPGIGVHDARPGLVINGTTFGSREADFRNTCTHLFLSELSEAAVRFALREGHGYVSHDWLCDPTGFAFGAVNNLGVFPMGDPATMQGTTRIVGLTPVAAKLKLLHHGVVVAQTNGTNLTFATKKPGAYRLEAWLDVAGEERPWIYSNPVYLQEQSIFAIPLPNGVESPNVEVKRDIVYADGDPEDAAKHKLDLYVPKDQVRAPVFVFIHGGAWRFGDRGLYPPVGQRFAREGILTVIPSYRLAPKQPWPAQAEDAAAAFAWTVRHIAAHGGDTNRIFVGGHSAGGHLSSLLACNNRFLKPHGLPASLIRGVVCLSGVYDLDVGDVQSSVFGKDRGVRRDASPMFFVKTPAPPFFVSYCQWDYATLPAQAKSFHAALQRAGVSSELFYTPKDNHIYEMISLTHDEDPTARAVVRFIQQHAGPAAAR